MGNNSSSSCRICREKIRKDQNLVRTACCQSSYHEECLEHMKQAGGTNCPACSAPLTITVPPLAVNNLPAPAVHNPPPLPPSPLPEALHVPAVYAQPLPLAISSPTVNQTTTPPYRQRPSCNNLYVSDLYISDPEEQVNEWVPTGTNSQMSRPKMIIEYKPEVPLIGTSTRKGFNAVVTLASSDDSTFAEDNPCDDIKKSVGKEDLSTKPPMDIICILDTSGSMSSDNKLTNLLHAVDYVRDELTENDRMSVITFTHTSKRIHNLLKMTDLNKVRVKDMVRQISANGGTKILSGMEDAANIICNRRSVNPITSVFLLTDGIDSSDMRRKKEVARQIRAAGASLFVYGFGADHDSAHLKEIANAAEGTFTYIEASDMVVDAFGGALGAEKSIIATDIDLQIEAEQGVRIISAHSGDYKTTLAPNGQIVTVKFRNLMAGEERDTLLKLDIDSTEAPVQQYPLLSAYLTYNSIQEKNKEHTFISPDKCMIDRVDESAVPKNVQRHADVDVQINREAVFIATEEGLRAADTGDFVRARAIMDKAIADVEMSQTFCVGNAKSRAFSDQLKKARRKCDNVNDYRQKGGRSEMTEMVGAVKQQRWCFNKSSTFEKDSLAMLYQTKSSYAMQSKGSRSKTISKV